MAAQQRDVKIFLANSEPSTHGTSRSWEMSDLSPVPQPASASGRGETDAMGTLVLKKHLVLNAPYRCLLGTALGKKRVATEVDSSIFAEGLCFLAAPKRGERPHQRQSEPNFSLRLLVSQAQRQPSFPVQTTRTSPPCP